MALWISCFCRFGRRQAAGPSCRSARKPAFWYHILSLMTLRKSRGSRSQRQSCKAKRTKQGLWRPLGTNELFQRNCNATGSCRPVQYRWIWVRIFEIKSNWTNSDDLVQYKARSLLFFLRQKLSPFCAKKTVNRHFSQNKLYRVSNAARTYWGRLI